MKYLNTIRTDEPTTAKPGAFRSRSAELSANKGVKMSNEEAKKIIETMPEDEFQAWFKTLPQRVQLCVKGGLVDWRECLATWYIKGKS